METMIQWIVPITQNLIATVIGVIVAILWQRRASIATVKGVAKSATMMMCWITWCVLRHVVVITLILTFLRREIETPAPLDRMAVLAITFYCIVLWSYFEQVVLRGHWDWPHLVQKDGSLWPPKRDE